MLFAILQKYDFSSKSQLDVISDYQDSSCLRYCKSTIFQANHNVLTRMFLVSQLFAILQKYDFSSKSQLNVRIKSAKVVVCDTAKVRFFKQITTPSPSCWRSQLLFAILQKYDFSSKSQLMFSRQTWQVVVCDTAKVRFFKQITTSQVSYFFLGELFAILQKYDFSSKSQPRKPSK